MTLSVIILALTNSEASFAMTMQCITSLRESEPGTDMEIILVESDSGYPNDFKYPSFVKVIVPKLPFGFHRFLNIGIAASAGDFVALCNNDLVFRKGWFSAMLEVARKHRGIGSFSPVQENEAAPNAEFICGYKVMTHIKGWCIVARRNVFDKIGTLDENFDFYYADNDYAMTLRSHNITHALVSKSIVNHLEKSRAASAVSNRNADFVKRYNIPSYLSDPKYDWLFLSEKNLSGFLAFHGKWGSPKWLYRKNKLADTFGRWGLSMLVPPLFKIKL